MIHPSVYFLFIYLAICFTIWGLAPHSKASHFTLTVLLLLHVVSRKDKFDLLLLCEKYASSKYFMSLSSELTILMDSIFLKKDVSNIFYVYGFKWSACGGNLPHEGNYMVIYTCCKLFFTTQIKNGTNEDLLQKTWTNSITVGRLSKLLYMFNWVIFIIICCFVIEVFWIYLLVRHWLAHCFSKIWNLPWQMC